MVHGENGGLGSYESCGTDPRPNYELLIFEGEVMRFHVD